MPRFKFFVKKICFSVFVLNSLEDKDSRFISGEHFRGEHFHFVLLLMNSFKYKPLRFTLDEDLHLIPPSYFIVWI